MKSTNLSAERQPANLPTLAEQIKHYHAACVKALNTGLRHAIKAGQLLTEAKHALLRRYRTLKQWERGEGYAAKSKHADLFKPRYTEEAIQVAAKRRVTDPTEFDLERIQGDIDRDKEIAKKVADGVTKKEVIESAILRFAEENEAARAFAKKLEVFDLAELLLLDEMVCLRLAAAERLQEIKLAAEDAT